MPLEILPATEADLPGCIAVHFAAFADVSMIHQIMYPKGVDDAVRADGLPPATEDFRNPNIRFMKAVDTDADDLQKVIAYSKWYFYKEERPREEWDVPWKASRKLKDVNYDALEAFIGQIKESRKRIQGGSKHAREYSSLFLCNGRLMLLSPVLGVLVTLPSYYRRGLGQRLIDWGLKIADEEGLVSYLEATPTGYPLYYRNGFRDIPGECLELDLKQFDWQGEGDGIQRTYCMKREPGGIKVIGGGDMECVDGVCDWR